MKRFLCSALVALLLIISLAVSSSAATVEENTLSFFLVDFNDSIVITEWPGTALWEQAFKEDRFGTIDGITYDGSLTVPALVYDPDNDGIVERYRLVYMRGDGRKMFVLLPDSFITYSYNEIENFLTNHPNYTNDDVFSNFDHYETVCTIRLLLDGSKEYVLTYPTSIWRWQDLVKQPDYVHPDLGTCRFEVTDGSLYLSVRSENGNTMKYSLVKESNNVAAPTDRIFLTGEAEANVSLVTLCPEGSHDLVAEIKTFPSCTTSGLQVYSCGKCDYSAEFSIPPRGHFFSKLIRTYEPTCPEVGYKICQCSGCTETRKVDIPIKHNYVPATCTTPAYCTGCGISNALALGHDFPIVGRCRRDGCTAYTGQSIVEGVGGFFSNVGSAVGDTLKDAYDNTKDVLDKAKEEASEKGSSFLNTIAITAGLAIAIPLTVLIVRLAKKFKKK